MVRQEVGRVSRRSQTVLASARHHSVPNIATIFGVSRHTVCLWIHRFNVQGPVGLYDEPRSGRPRKPTQGVNDSLYKMMQFDTQQEEDAVTCGVVATLLLALTAKLKAHLSPSAIRGALHQLGLCWGRPRLGMPDPALEREHVGLLTTVEENLLTAEQRQTMEGLQSREFVDCVPYLLSLRMIVL